MVFSESHASRLLYNSTVVVALLWAPNYFYFRSSPEEMHRWASPELRTMLGDEIYKVFIFLADNVEFISQGSLDLLLDSILFSSKLKSSCSVKLFTLSLSSGLINWRAPLFGGGAEEITAMERFLSSAECRRVRERYKRRIVAFTDRGFSRLSAELLDGIYLLHPGLQELRGQYTAEHAVWKQVRSVRRAGTHI
jgi:hypothetical protein